MYSQANYYPLVKTSGAGETTLNNFDYSHHSNYTMRIVRLTAKWKLTTLFGEPVIDGIFKWVAASNTPANYLDYRDCILLECSPVKSTGYSVYIKLTPTVPKSGEGYGYNTPGSPSWANVFCTRKGQDITHEIPGFTANTAKAIWKNGFRVTGIVLTRTGGSDGYLQAKKNNNSGNLSNISENTATQNDPKQKEAIEQQKQLSQQAKDKYNALKSPYTLNVNNRDTISETNFHVLKNINPYFKDGVFTINSVSNGKVISNINTVNANLKLAEGWNMLRIAIKGDNYDIKDSVMVYYKKKSLNHNLDGIWDRGDIEILISGQTAKFYKIKSGDWGNYLNRGIISLETLKVKDISNISSNTWKCSDLWKFDNKTYWNSASLELSTDGNTIILESRDSSGKVVKNIYSRK